MSPMDALWVQMQCDLDVVMVGRWVLCGIGWSLISLIWTSSRGPMDALWVQMESDLDVITVILLWPMAYGAYGCFAGSDGV